MTNQIALVKSMHDLYPPPQTIEGALAFTLRIARMLSVEGAGLLSKPTGENIAYFEGRYVSAGRLCYPDGAVIKVLTDVPATNGPSWQDNGMVDPARRIVVTPEAPPEPIDEAPAPAPQPDVVPAWWVGEVQAKLDALKVQADANTEKIQQQIHQAVKDAEATAKQLAPMIPFIQRFFR